MKEKIERVDDCPYQDTHEIWTGEEEAFLVCCYHPDAGIDVDCSIVDFPKHCPLKVDEDGVRIVDLEKVKPKEHDW